MKINELPTPCYVIDEKKLRKNLEILKKVKDDTGCKILLAQKAFSNFFEYPLIGQYLDGTTASGLFEAKLGYEKMGKENHVFAPAFKESEIGEITDICEHLVFNSFSQLEKYADFCKEKGQHRHPRKPGVFYPGRPRDLRSLRTGIQTRRDPGKFSGRSRGKA